jgi:beta-galactosidase
MRRDSQNFPAAGLRWNVAFASGSNKLRAVAFKDGATVADEIGLIYQTEPWGKPARFRLSEKARNNNLITVEARLVDADGVLCLDAATNIRFSVAGAGSLVDNLGTTRASRDLQLSNGRAEISVFRHGDCKIQAKSEGLSAAFLNL